MVKCPAPKRVISEVVDGTRRQEFLENFGVIVFDAQRFCYSPLRQKEISQTAWRLGPDPIWDELWTRFRGRWRIVIGTVPFESDKDNWIARGAPVCGWIAVQFDSEDEWGRYVLATKKTMLGNLGLSEAENEPVPAFDPERIIPCPVTRRAVSGTTDEHLEGLRNVLIVYAFDGLAEPVGHGRLTCGKIGLEMDRYGRRTVTPDRLFDYLHSKYPGRWWLYLNTFSLLSSRKLAVSFAFEDDLVDFRNSWRGRDVSSSETAAILHVSRTETPGESTHA